MSISAVLIVRDEAESIARCLESLRPAVDEIVVVDTGSTDPTMIIAEAHADITGEFAWRDDFAAARNAALALATCTHVLTIDADEWLEQPDVARDQFNAFTTRDEPGYVGLVSIINESVPGGDLQQTAVDAAARLFRREDFEYAGRIHEQLRRRDGGAIRGIHTGIRVRHSGYAQPPDSPDHKARRNIPLLRAAMAESPDDEYLHYQLGKSWFSLGRYRAAAIAFKDALRRIDFDARPPVGAQGPMSIEVLTGLVCGAAYALVRAEHREEALALLRQHAELGHAGTILADFQHALGYAHLQLGHWDEAEAAYRASLGLDEHVVGTGSFASWYHIGLVAEARGRPELVFEATRTALEQEPGYRPALARVTTLAAQEPHAARQHFGRLAEATAFQRAYVQAVRESLEARDLAQSDALLKAAQVLHPALYRHCREALEWFRA